MTKNICPLKRIFIVELSEFNIDLLTQAIKLYSLPYLSKILDFKKSNYKTNDRYNSGYLTPAIQWEAIHKGVSSRHSGIKGELASKFFWQILNDHQITTIYENLEPYENYRFLLKKAFKSGCLFKILKEIFKFRLKSPKNTQRLAKRISQLDYLSTLVLCAQKRRHQAQCSILLLRSLAHCQAYHWSGVEKISPELEYNLKIINKILGYLMSEFPEDSFIIHNAITQIRPSQFVPLGTVYSQDIHFPNHIFNYEFNQYIYHYFLPEVYRLKSEYIEDEVTS